MNKNMKRFLMAGTALVATSFIGMGAAHATELNNPTHPDIVMSDGSGLLESNGTTAVTINTTIPGGAIGLGANGQPSVVMNSNSNTLTLNVTATGTGHGVVFYDNVTAAAGNIVINTTTDSLYFHGDVSNNVAINGGSVGADVTTNITVNTLYDEDITFQGTINTVDAGDIMHMGIYNNIGTARIITFTRDIGGGSDDTRLDSMQIGADTVAPMDVRFQGNVNVQGNITLGMVGANNNINAVRFGLNGQSRSYTGTIQGAHADDTNNVIIVAGSTTNFNSPFGDNLDNITIGGTGTTTTTFHGSINAVSGAVRLMGGAGDTNNITFDASGRGGTALVVAPVFAGQDGAATHNITIAGGANQIVRMTGGGTDIDSYTINSGTTLEYQGAAINNVSGAGGILTLNRMNAQGVTGDIGASGAGALHSVNLAGSGTKTLAGAIYAATTNIDDVIVDAAGSIVGNTNFTANGRLNFAHNAGTTGSISASTAGHGAVHFAGSAAVDGTVGAVNDIGTISIDGDNTRTVEFKGAVKAGTLAFTSDGVATLTSSSGTSTLANLTKSGAGNARLNMDGTALTVNNINVSAGNLDLNFGANGILNLGNNQTLRSILSTTPGHGTLNYTGGLNLTGDLGQLNTLTVTSPLSVGGNATAANAMDVGIQTVTVGGTFATTADTQLTYRVNTPTTSGKITAAGQATVVAGTKVNMVVDTNVYVAQGQEFVLIDGHESGGHVAKLADGNLTTTNTALLHFKQKLTDVNNLIVYADRTQMNVAAKDPNAAAVGTMLDKLGGSANPDINDLQVRLGKLMSNQEVEDVLKTLHTDPTGASASSIAGVGNATSTVTSGRIDSVRTGAPQSGVSSGDSEIDKHVWMQGFGASADQGRRDGVAGYDADSYGFVAGIDTDVSDDLLLGVAVAYAVTNANGQDANRSGTDIDSYQISVYGNQDLGDKYFLTGQLSYMYSDIDTVRYNVGGVVGNTARANFGADQYTARAELGRAFDIGSGISLTPSGLINYNYIDMDDYSEKGAGGLALRNVDTDEMQTLEFGVNLKAEAVIDDGIGGAIRPNIHGGVRHDVVGDDVATTAFLAGGGAAFKTEGFDAAQTTGNIGFGLTWETSVGLDFTANYDYEHKSDYDAHSGYLRAGYRF